MSYVHSMLKFAPLGPMGKEEPYVVGREILSVSRGVHRKSELGIPQIKGQATAFVAGFVPRFCFAGDSVKQMPCQHAFHISADHCHSLKQGWVVRFLGLLAA